MGKPTVVAKPGMNWGKEIFLILITCGLWTPVTIIKNPRGDPRGFLVFPIYLAREPRRRIG